MHIEHHYQWRYKDRLGKWQTTSHLCSEQSIKKMHPEATPVTGTLRVTEVADTLTEYWERTRQCTAVGGPAPDKRNDDSR